MHSKIDVRKRAQRGPPHTWIWNHFGTKKCSKNEAEKRAKKGTILEAFWASFWTPVGDKRVQKWYQNSGHGPRGVQSGLLGPFWTSILDKKSIKSDKNLSLFRNLAPDAIFFRFSSILDRFWGGRALILIGRRHTKHTFAENRFFRPRGRFRIEFY